MSISTSATSAADGESDALELL
ncbi:MAG: hypothetical protein QOF00_1868, partial [Pseudonocardiales bacterium]|nr:hypothetical protein [Pseudonocardiales bacterium]